MKVEVRAQEIIISGYVNAICRDSRVLELPDGTKYVEQVAEGVFARAINNNPEIFLKLNHDRVMGSTKDGVLTLKEDNIGLYAVAKFQDEEVLQAAEAGKITGWSFGFRCIDDEWTYTDEYYKRRILKDIQLNEVSLLVGLTPAYAGTSYEMRGEKVELVETRSFDGMAVAVEKKEPPAFLGLENKRKWLDIEKGRY